jgi:ecotin
VEERRDVTGFGRLVPKPRFHENTGITNLGDRMKIALAQLLIAAVIMQSATVLGSGHPELKAFPLAEKGFERFAIALPHKARGEDDAFRIEIIVGKEMLTDGVNLVRLGNAIEHRTLDGWGYSYYVVSGSSNTISTMMAPPEGAPLVKTFVTVTPLHVRYNSRLPIVVYVPTGYEVRYRIWQANETIEKADKE